LARSGARQRSCRHTKSKRFQTLPTQKRLRQLFHYAPKTGLFYRRSRCVRACEGREAGSSNGDGYRKIRVDGRKFFAHRLAWVYVKGRQPRGEIDHKDGNRANNRIANLRDGPHDKNTRNVTTRSASGFKGVYRHRNKWMAKIMLKGRSIYLGDYDTAEKAAAAYDKAARLYHGEFARTNAMIRAQRAKAAKAAAARGSVPNRTRPRRSYFLLMKRRDRSSPARSRQPRKRYFGRRSRYASPGRAAPGLARRARNGTALRTA
jgi:hypothetical protein